MIPKTLRMTLIPEFPKKRSMRLEDLSSNPVPWMQAYFPAVCGDSNGQNYTWSTNFGSGYFGAVVISAVTADVVAHYFEGDKRTFLTPEYKIFKII